MTLLDPAATADARLRQVLDVVMRWLVPDGISSGSAMVEISGLVDPLPAARSEFGGLLEEIDRSPIPAARVEPIPGGVAEKQSMDDVMELARQYAHAYFNHHTAEGSAGDMLSKTRDALRAALSAVSLPSSTPGLDPKGANASVGVPEWEHYPMEGIGMVRRRKEPKP